MKTFRDKVLMILRETMDSETAKALVTNLEGEVISLVAKCASHYADLYEQHHGSILFSDDKLNDAGAKVARQMARSIKMLEPDEIRESLT